jgi:hypothetical protein
MDPVARLKAIEAIKIVKANYFLGVDTKDWELLRREVLCEQSRFDLPEMNDASIIGGEAIIAFFTESLTPWVTVHHGHAPIIEITSDTEATGIWAMEDRIYGSPGQDISWIHGFGHYHENYVRLGVEGTGGWRLGRFTLKRLRVETGRIF